MWDAMRRDEPGESIVVVPSVAPDADAHGPTLQALRGALPVPAAPAPRSRGCASSTSPGGRCAERSSTTTSALLPGVIPRQARRRLHMLAAHDGSRAAAGGEAARAPAPARRVARADPRPGALPSRPLRDHAAGARPRALPRHPALRRRPAAALPSAPRPAAGGCSPRRASRIRWARGRPRRRRTSSTRSPACGRRRAAMAARDREAQRGRLRPRQRASSTCAACPRPAPRTSARRCATGWRRWRFEHAGTPRRRVPRAARARRRDRRGARRRRRRCAARACSCASRRCGDVELLSTHDQVLGGPSGQSYLGCRFPADPAYAAAITAEAARIGGAARARGRARPLRRRLRGRARRRRRGWRPYAIELNLRKGGTTPPFLTLQFLTDGALRRRRPAPFTAPDGRPKHLVATDHLESTLLRGMTVDDLFDVAVRHGLHFDHARQTGVVFHMMSALSELGMLGVTAVGDSPEAGGRPVPARRAGAARGGRRAARAGRCRRSERPAGGAKNRHAVPAAQ